MKTVLLSILVLAVLSGPAFGDEKKLPEWLDAGSWAEGVDYCDHKLVDDLSHRSDLRSLSAEYLSRLVVYCSALAGGKGDEAGSGWWWYTAVSLDFKAAQNLLAELQKKGLLQTLPAPRSRGPEVASWRFEPAKVNDEPVECFYRLTVSTQRG
jgi:hypothetical protein